VIFIFYNAQNQKKMLTNYLKLAWRNLSKNKLYSLINIGGLGLGMAVCMLILLYVTHELSFDRYHEKAERIFSTLMKLKLGENDLQMNRFTPDFAQKVKAANPEVLEVARITSDFRELPTLKSEEGRQFIEPRFFFADGSIFRIFSFNLLRGDAASALESPEAVAISDEMSKKYFGEADPIGKNLIYNKKDLLRVTAVFEKMPKNSSLQFDFLAATAVFENIQRRENPGQNFDIAPDFETWVLLDKTSAVSKVEATIPTLIPKTDDPVFNNATYVLSPLTEKHLGNNWGDFSNSKYISVFLSVAGLVLFLALFNYMNLTTARAASRAREVGVRKVLGAQVGQLRGQFYGESVLVSALGFVAGMGTFMLLRPTFCDLLELKIEERFLYSSLFVSVLGILFLLSALVAGSYPAFLLSRFSPIQIMKGDVQSGRSGAGVRRGLTVFQFAVSTGLIAFSLGIGAQLRYMHKRDIGMNREQVLVMPLTKNINPHTAAFKQEIRAQAGVQKVASCSFALFQGGWDMTFLKSPTTQEDIGINNMVVDENFFETLEIQWITIPANPRNLAPEHQVLLNESGIEKLKFSENPVGRHLDLGRGQQAIAGIVRDFNFVSLQMPIEGMLFEVVADTAALRNRGGQLYVRFARDADLQSQLAALGRIYKKYEPDVPFDYYFLDEAFDKQHRAEQRMGYLFSGFSVVAVFLACLGLLGLITFTAERRTKEIGIRKVLGASVAGITGLLAKDFLKLVLVAILIASPLAFYFMKKWLSDFAYRIEMEWWMFAGAGLAAVAIAFLTVGFQSVKAALVNPVKSLRSE
jgi:putative ABC transport system permease protein